MLHFIIHIYYTCIILKNKRYKITLNNSEKWYPSTFSPRKNRFDIVSRILFQDNMIKRHTLPYINVDKEREYSSFLQFIHHSEIDLVFKQNVQAQSCKRKRDLAICVITRIERNYISISVDFTWRVNHHVKWHCGISYSICTFARRG